MPSSWGKTFIALISKKENPKLVFDFWPISLCSVRFKIISKILDNLLKLVLPHLIGREQVGFVSGSCSFDNIIYVREVVHSLEYDSNGPSRMLIKLDIEKAYDTLSWSAILVALTKMDFPNTWISWISTCLNSSSFFFFSLMEPPLPSFPLPTVSVRVTPFLHIFLF